MSELFGRSEPRVGDLSNHDAVQLEESLATVIGDAQGVTWYEPGREADLAVARLCLLRRARAGVGASPEAGDDAVRLVLAESDPESVDLAPLPRDLVHGRAGLPRPRARSPNRVVPHSHGDDERRLGDRRALRGALALVAAFAVVEVVAGYAAGSLALLADAGHMLGDAGSLGLALFAAWLGSRPASPERTFGYRRAEILAALANGVALVAIAIWIVVEALQRLRDPVEPSGGWVLRRRRSSASRSTSPPRRSSTAAAPRA